MKYKVVIQTVRVCPVSKGITSKVWVCEIPNSVAGWSALITSSRVEYLRSVVEDPPFLSLLVSYAVPVLSADLTFDWKIARASDKQEGGLEEGVFVVIK